MVWQSGSENEEYSDRPYSTLSGGAPRRFMARTEFPFILVGAGLLLLLVLFLIFFPGKEEPGKEAATESSSRLDRIEGRLAELEDLQEWLDTLQVQVNDLEKAMTGDQQAATPDTQVVDQLKANRQELQQTSETIQKLSDRFNLLEKRLNRMENRTQAVSTTAAKKPAETKADSGTAVYRVKKGDTLYRIARNNGVELDRFLKMNGLREDSVIKPGQELKIPAD